MSKKIKDGPYKSYHKNGKLFEEGIYKNNGSNYTYKYKTYYDNGKLQSEGTMKNGERHGPYKNYYNNGNLKKEGTWTILNGVSFNDKQQKSYFRNGNLEWEQTFKIREDFKGNFDSRNNGPYKSYYEDGKLKKEGKYVDDGLSMIFRGTIITYYKKGQLQTEFNNEKEPNFFLKKYYKNGNLKLDITLQQSFESLWSSIINPSLNDILDDIPDGLKPDGPFKLYYENGQPKEVGTYKYDKLDGPFKLYYENGQLKEERTYKNGLDNGSFKFYNENGQLELEETYKDGEIID